MLVGELEALLDALAPKELAEPGDNCGLLVGDVRASYVIICYADGVIEVIEIRRVAGSNLVDDGYWSSRRNR